VPFRQKGDEELLNDLILTYDDFTQFAQNCLPNLSDAFNSLNFPQFRFCHGGFPPLTSGRWMCWYRKRHKAVWALSILRLEGKK
jgi:hypothetical protein